MKVERRAGLEGRGSEIPDFSRSSVNRSTFADTGFPRNHSAPRPQPLCAHPGPASRLQAPGLPACYSEVRPQHSPRLLPAFLFLGIHHLAGAGGRAGQGGAPGRLQGVFLRSGLSPTDHILDGCSWGRCFFSLSSLASLSPSSGPSPLFTFH